MSKAVIEVGGSQHFVSEGDVFSTNRVLKAESKKQISVHPLMIVDGEKSKIGSPELTDSKVTLKIINDKEKADKVIAIRYKSKKRVHKKRGHRQLLTTLKVDKIEA